MRRSRLVALAITVAMVATVAAPLTPMSLAAEPPTDGWSPPSNDEAARADSLQSLTEETGAIISNGTVTLGVNPEGHLNVPGGPPSAGSGTTTVGLRYQATGNDAISPGCRCEGWGVGDVTSGVSGWASVDNAGVSTNLEVELFGQFGNTAHSSVVIKDGQGAPVLRVSHLYMPSPESESVYIAYVSIQNATADRSVDAAYRRVMDWDVEPTWFNEYVTFVGDPAVEPWLHAMTNNGFDHPDPLRPPTPISGVPPHTGQGQDVGHYDHGALFDFRFGEIRPGETVQFEIFYGATGTEAEALAALSTVQAPVYSLGQPATDPVTGTPNTFLFGFSRPDCLENLSAVKSSEDGTREGKTSISVIYDPRTLTDHRHEHWEAINEGIVTFIRDDFERAFDHYQAAGLNVPGHVDVTIRCDLFSGIGLFPSGAPALAAGDNQVQLRTIQVQNAYRTAIEGWDPATDGDLPEPSDYLKNWLVDHEAFHSVHAAAKKLFFTNIFDAITLELGHDRTNWESGAVLGSDLAPDYDDAAGTSYLHEAGELLGRRTLDDLDTLSAIAYDGQSGTFEYEAGSIFQYWAEQTRSDPDLEARTASFLKSLIESKGTREAALWDALDGHDPYDLLRDYFVAAWVNGAANAPARFTFKDETTFREPGPGQPPGAPAPYPAYVLNAEFQHDLVNGVASTGSRTLRHGQGVIETVDLPAGGDRLAVTVRTLSGNAPRVGFVPFDGPHISPPTGDVAVRDKWLRRGPDAHRENVTIVDATGYDSLAIVVASTNEDVVYEVEVEALGGRIPGLDVLVPGPEGAFVDLRSPGLGEFWVDVEPTTNGQVLSGWLGSDFVIRINGQPVQSYGAVQDGDRYRVYAAGPGGLADGFHDLSVEFRGVVVQRPDGLRVSSPNTDPGQSAGAGSLGTLGQTETAAREATIASGSTAAAFSLAWLGSDFDLALTAPSGRSITETTIAGDVEVRQGSATVEIEVSTPEAGTWQITATGVDVPEPEPVTYQVLEFGTPMRVDLAVQGTQAGLPIVARVPIRSGTAMVDDAQVWAEVTDPIGTIRRFPLLDDGGGVDLQANDGVFSVEAWATDLAGAYSISVDALGNIAGSPFARHVASTLSLGPKADRDLDGVADQAEPRFGLDPDVADASVDTDFDGLAIADELRAGTDPALPDTDSGGEPDKSELQRLTNPRDASDDAEPAALHFAARPLDGHRVWLQAGSPNGAGVLTVTRSGPGGSAVVAVPLDGSPVIDGPLPAGQYRYVATLTVGGVTGLPVVVNDLEVGADVTAPIVDLEINGGAPSTEVRDVVLRFVNASEPLAEARVASTEAALASAAWVPFAEVMAWQLEDEPGVQFVYAQVRDAGGNTSPIVASAISLNSITGWRPSQPLTEAIENADWQPRVAVGGDGAATIIWNMGVIYSARQATADSPWSAPQRVNDLASGSLPYNAAIAAGPNGDVFAVWEDRRNGRTDIYFAKRSAATGTWGPNVRVNTSTTFSEQSRPDIAVSPSGDAVAVWYRRVTTVVKKNQQHTYHIYSARLANGASAWGPEIKVSTDTAATKFGPKVVVGADGASHAVWTQPATGDTDIWYARLVPGAGTWTGHLKVSDGPVNTLQNAPDLAVDGAGRLTLSWSDSRSVGGEIRVRQRTPAGTWGPSIAFPTTSAYASSVSAAPSGRVLLTWVGAGTWLSEFDPVTGQWSPPEQMDDDLVGRNLDGGVAISDDHAVVVWQRGLRVHDDNFANHVRARSKPVGE